MKQDFLFKLREEMAQIEQRRFQFQLAKVTSLGTLTGVGILLVEKLKIQTLFYVIPFIALAFDLFIASESFRLKRISNFISKEKQETRDIEFRWEN